MSHKQVGEGVLDVLRVGVTGASGFVGRALTAALRDDGHTVRRLPRRPTILDVTNVDAVVHLAGEPVFAPRWTKEKKRRIRDSRIEGTRHLAETIADTPPSARPRVLISASAIGLYGSRGDEVLDERSDAGHGFLADVVRGWEAATRPAHDVGVRVAQLRIGVVLDGGGGALPRMAAPYRLGTGGPLGDPDAWLSWITLEDLVGVITRCLHDDDARGPINAVGGASTQGELARALGRALRRPSFARVPKWALRTVLGREQADEMLASARVEPRKLREMGHQFEHEDLSGALQHALSTGGAR